MLARVGMVAALITLVASTTAVRASAQAEAAVSVSKSASVSSAPPGTPFSYALRYSCSSLVTTCSGVTITDVLPPQLSRAVADVTLVGDSHTVKTAYDPATGTAIFTLASPLPAGTTGEVDITVKFPPGTTPVGAAATNVASIAGTNAPTSSSNPSTVTAVVTPGIATTKTLSSSPIVLGANTTYTVTYKNTGNINLTSPTLVDTLPPGARFVSASGGGTFNATTNQVTWTLASPATPGTTSSQTVTVIYPSPPFVAGQPITNNVAGTGIPLGTTTPLSQPASATSTPVAPAPAVVASKSPGGPIALGRPFTYTVSVKNTGNVGLNPVTMLDSFPAGTSFVSATGGGTFSSSAGTVSWTFPSPPLAPGATFTATVTVTYNTPPFTAGQTVTNNLSTSGTPVTGGPAVTGNASVNNTLTAPQTGGRITKTLLTPAAQFALDTPVQYQVMATNTGDVALAGFTITDPLPTGATFVSASNGGTLNAANTVTWTSATPLAAGATQTVTVTVIYPSTTFTPGQLVTNTAQATGTANGVPVPMGPTGVTNALQPNNPAATVAKAGTRPTVPVGGSDTYTITATNTGNVPLSPFVVTDLIPDNLQPVTPGSNVSFTDPRGIATARSDVLAYHNPATNQFVTVATTCTGSGTGTCAGSIPASADQIQITYSGPVAPGFASTATLALRVPANAVSRSALPITAGDTIQNCATVSASQLSSTLQSCTSQTVTEPVPTMTMAKVRTSPSPVPPPSTVSWQLTFGAPATSLAPILNPVITDCLPGGLDLVNPANPGDPVNGSPPAAFAPAPSITRVVNGCGPNTIQVVWSWAGSDPTLSIPPGTTGVFTLNSQIQPGQAPGTLTNTASAIADNNPTPVTSSASVIVATGASLESLKLIKGSLDPAYNKFPDVGHTTVGGSADYRLTVTNTGNIPMNRVTVIDILPFVGDTAVLNAGAARDSQWSPILTGPVTAPAGVTVSYSTSSNPCRPELNYSPPGCVSGSFTTSTPSPISSVSSLKFDFGTTVLAPGQTFQLAWPMSAPPNVTPGDIAWNSFGFTGFRTDNGSQLTPAEPNKVGIVVTPYPLILEKDVNGSHQPAPPGLYLPTGQPVTYTYIVSNPGDLTVASINVADNPAQVISCPATQIPPHSSITCTAAAGPAATGPHADSATVVGQPQINGAPAGPPTAPATDTANYLGVTPAVTLVKTVNGQNEPTTPGLYVPVGDPVSFGYLVTNTGSVTLDPVTLSDNQLGAITCPETVLAPGDSETCTATASGGAAVGQQTNVATATGQAVDNTGSPVGSPVTATDTANYFGANPAIIVIKEVNDHPEPVGPGLFVPVGDPVTFSYTVTNTGNLTLSPVTLDDNVLGAITCPETSLPAGASETCTAPGSNATPGAHQNTATATGQGVDNTGAAVGTPVSATDTANYFGTAPAITLTKEVNGQHDPMAPGLYIPVRDPVTFTYVVTNTGNVTLDPVTLDDTVLGAITCPQSSLGVGASETCTPPGGNATPGAHQNTATATGQGVDDTGAAVGTPVSATGTANYFGAAPAITLTKEVNGQHEPDAPGLDLLIGEPVTFTFLVTNTGNVTLDPVTLTDTVLGSITCPQTSLAAGASETCTATGGDAALGQHTNQATANGQGVDNTGGPVGPSATATDTANYFGSERLPAISLVKDVDGHHEPTPPGLYIPVGDPVTFTYLLTNIGDSTVASISVVDDVLGTITCPQTSLAPGDTETCTAPGGKAVAGEHQNAATATAQPLDSTGRPTGSPVNATDGANYFGSAAAITVTKDINGQHEPTAPGLNIAVGAPLTFTYTINNTGNVSLDPVTLTDNVLGLITCPQSSLTAGASETCTAPGGNASAGQHQNIATVTAQAVDNTGAAIGSTSSATDPADYTGVVAPSTSPTPATTSTTSTISAATPVAESQNAQTAPAETPEASSTTTPSETPAALAVTGALTAELGRLGGVLIVAGMAVLALNRRRRRHAGRHRASPNPASPGSAD